MNLFPRHIQPGLNWPSLLLGPKGTRTALHIDSDATHFWLLLLKGKKKWRIFPAQDRDALYQNAFDDSLLITGFEDAGEVMRLQERVSPSLNETMPWEFTMEAGDLVIVPHKSPHQVENLEDTVAVAGNFIDELNWEGFRDIQDTLRFLDPHVTEKVSKFIKTSGLSSRGHSDIRVDMKQEDAPWATRL